MEMFLLAAVVGVGVGILSGLLGIGGGTIMVPLFRLGFSMEPIMATATSLFTIVPTSLTGMGKHVRNKTSLPRVGVICGIAGAFLSPAGVWAANVSPGWLVMAAAAAVVVYSSATMFKKAFAAPKSNGAKGASSAASDAEGASATPAQPAGEACAPRAGSASTLVPVQACAGAAVPQSAVGSAPHAVKLTPAFVAKALFIGVLAGFLSGYVGVGGGFVMVPLFVSLLGVPMRLASGTSLTAVCILAVPGVVEQALLGNIDYAVGIAMAVGSIPGAIVGANLVRRVPERTLRFIFACFLLVVAVIMVLNEAGEVGLLG